MQHFVLTRHAIAYNGRPPSVEWVHRRRNLLVHLAANSLMHQTVNSFEWLVFVDSALADEEADFLSQSVGSALTWRVVPVSDIDGRGGKTLWVESLGPLSEGQRVVTTRMDSDDTLHPTFIEAVGNIARGITTPTAVDMVSGAFVDSSAGIPLTRPYRASPFQSLVEVAVQDLPVVTVMARPHPDLPQSFPYLPVTTPHPMWFVSVHGGNIGNRAFGRPRPADVVPDHLRQALGVRRATPPERWIYGMRIAREYSRRFVEPGLARQAAQTLAGHLSTLGRKRSRGEQRSQTRPS